jgi:hypothetical protein
MEVTVFRSYPEMMGALLDDRIERADGDIHRVAGHGTLARLEASAPTHSILVSSETALLAEDEFVTEASEPVLVKGFEKPVPVFRVLRQKPA